MYKSLISIATLLALSGCGGGGGDSSSANPNPPEVKTTLTLGISDAPVTNIAAVWVAFDNILLRAESGQDTSIELSSEDNTQTVRMVNLLDYTGDDIYQLFAGQEVLPGKYSWIRANVINGDSSNYTSTSHVVYKDGTFAPLVVNRKSNDGIGEIQLDGFDLVTGANQFVMEFDLKKSLVDPKNSDEIVLKPRGVRLENLAQKTTLSGAVAAQLMADCEAQNALLANVDNGFEHAIYLYNSNVETPTDIYYENDVASASSPIATALINLKEDGSGEYEIGFLAQGNYKVSYTCLAHLDNPDTTEADFSVYRTQLTELNSQTSKVDFVE